MNDPHPELVLSAAILRPFMDDVVTFLDEVKQRQSEIQDTSSTIRNEMIRLEFIKPSHDENGQILPLHAVDSSSHEVTLGTLTTSVALAMLWCEGKEPRHTWGRISGPNSEAFRNLSSSHRLQLELRLLCDTQELTIADNSFWSMMIDSNKIIRDYEDLGDNAEAFSMIMKECFDSSEDRTFIKMLTNPNVIAVPKKAVGTTIGNREAYRKFLKYEVPDRSLLSSVLLPGERTQPIPIKETASMGLKLPTNVERRQISHDDGEVIKNTFLRELLVVFYRPWPYRGAYRIEYHRSRFPNAQALSDLFATVKDATRLPTYMEPVPQYLADRFCQDVHQVAMLYGSINYFRFPDVLHFTRSSDIERHRP